MTSPVDDPRLATLVRRIATRALWAPLAVVVLHSALGAWFGHEPVVDPIMHFSGGAAAAYFFWESAVHGRRYVGRPSPLALALMAFGLAASMAVFWEFGEFVVDRVRGSHIQHGLVDTMRDLALGLTGAFLFVIVWLGRSVRDRRPPEVRARTPPPSR